MVDDAYELHVEATAFLAGLRARGLSVNTERLYAGRVAQYLSYCATRGLPWSQPGFLGLRGFQDWLVSEPAPPRRRGGRARLRAPGTANAVLTSVAGFLRFGATQGWVPDQTVSVLVGPTSWQSVSPPGFDPGEAGQWRPVTRATLRFRTVEPGVEVLSDAQIRQLQTLTGRARDRFLIALLACTGVRIGEALGLRREDMHLLATSTGLGCEISGPHIHVRRRADNANGALAKSRYPRVIPVTADLVAAYTDYRRERDRVAEAGETDMVLVNLFRAPLGRAMRYPAVHEMFERLSAAAGFRVRPHLFRHTAATRWLAAGVDRDVVQHLLGHVSPSSMQPYLHVDARATRDAVERVAATTAATR
ncbi:site-specific recombinase XerD [Pseudonocardia autotrophica]|uniref:Tyrosine recombinase XerD n=2 Tax=Pseudonocardia TaxID=1847 RepID=A0A1Y2N8A6_PSEAH|nr:Tyrosine recombinase XerD [Pseudonocardia autotrophica]TDN73324.1 site-specific recombinase XerD [Pseudonocardia autotrophica]BBG04062.1 integrase [Pseudonocardia autotrophica]GEC26199.1 integrase [Pseudonocardia saturnea]